MWSLKPSKPSSQARVHQLVGRASGLEGQRLWLPLPLSLDAVDEVQHQELQHREDHEETGVPTSLRAFRAWKSAPKTCFFHVFPHFSTCFEPMFLQFSRASAPQGRLLHLHGDVGGVLLADLAFVGLGRLRNHGFRARKGLKQHENA